MFDDSMQTISGSIVVKCVHGFGFKITQCIIQFAKKGLT